MRNARILSVLKPAIVIALLSITALCAAQQAAPKASPTPEGQPQIKVNVLNVCRLSAPEQAEIKNAFSKAAPKPAFSRDFEITRGRATVKDGPESRFVRLRRDMAPESALLATQYSMSRDATHTIETLVLRSRDTKDFHELVLEDRVSAGAASPQAVLSVETPVTRIRLERLGKSSIVLTRCPDADQSAFEPLFREASDAMARYRKALGLAGSFRGDIAWLSSEENSAKPAAGKTTARKTSK